MKRTILFSFVILAMIGCRSKTEKVAIESLKELLKCPNSLKIVEVKTLPMIEEEIDSTKMWHIAKINGKKGSTDSYYQWDLIRSIHIDSVRYALRRYPAHKVVTITFDAQNEYGAVVRDTKDFYVAGTLKPMTWDEWFYFFRIPTYSEPIPFDTTLEKFHYDCYHYQVGDWKEKNNIIYQY